MKKLVSLLVIALFAIGTVSADEVVTRDESKLPQQAKLFLNEHFQGSEISYIKIESEFLKGKNYEVVLTNGVEIEFDSNGHWKDIDCKRSEVPAALIPDYARNYIDANFKGKHVTQIERDRSKIEFELNNDLTVEFDRNGNFIRLDD